MSIVELALTSLAEATATAMHREHDSRGFGHLQGDAHEAGENYKTLTQPIQQRQLLDGEDETSDQDD
jgi:hypothetical protein